jgi:bifunctional non-homologous end joining protein LigD
MPRGVASRRRTDAAALPQWIAPQLTQLVDAAPEGDGWLHEIKFDGYRMHERLDRGAIKLLTRTGLDWTHKYPPIAEAVASLGARQAYLDGELCGVFPDGITSFSLIQAASDAGNAAGLVYFIFDLLHLDGEDVGVLPLIERKARLAELLSGAAPPLHYSGYHRGRGPAFHAQACKAELEGIVSKRGDAPYAPGNRGIWLKVKCLYRQEFVVVGWTDPERRRSLLVLCCSPVTNWSMPAAPAPGSTPPSWSAYGGGCSRSRPTECRSTWRHRAPATSAHISFQPRALVPTRAGGGGEVLTRTDDGLLRRVVYERLRGTSRLLTCGARDFTCYR